MKTTEQVRFDTRLPKEQKDFFEYAASLGGFRTLTEFVISSAQKQAKKIVAGHNKILASKRDREIFFNAIMNPEKPNEKLKNAMDKYEKTFGV